MNPQVWQALGEQVAFDALRTAQREAWGRSHSGSAAITGESARLLGLPGYTVRPSLADADQIARVFLDEVAHAKPSRRWLYHGYAGRWACGVEQPRRRPLTALTDDEDSARAFGSGGDSTVFLKFAPGIKARRHSAVEWITAGDFVVQTVAHERDSCWGTPLTTVTLCSA